MSYVDQYLSIDLDAARQALLDQVDNEATQTSVVLSGPLDTAPSALTPEMHAWYRENIDPLRRNALGEVSAAFERDRTRDVKGFILEVRREEALLRRDSQRFSRAREFFRENNSAVEDYRIASREWQTARAAEQGRKPIDVSLGLYLFGLLIVWIAEAFLNFESFLLVPFIHSPFIAFGTTVLIGFSIAWASHLHGTVLRQWDYFFGPEDKTRNWIGLRLISIGSLLFTVPMVLVGGARYYFLIPQLDRASMLGTAPPSIPLSIAFMLLGNTIVYLVGVVWAFFCHDPLPEYPKRARAFDAARRRFQALYKRQVQAELVRLQKIYENEERQIASEDQFQREAPNYDANRATFNRLEGFDAKVVGILQRYRTELVRRAQSHGGKIRFELPDIDVETGEERRTLTGDEYLGIALALKHHGATPQ